MKEKQIRVKKDIIIPAGTIMKQAPSRTDRLGFHADCTLSFGPNALGFFEVQEEVLEHASDAFELVE